MYAVIRVRGNVQLKQESRDTMKMLNLTRCNHLSLIEETEKNKGMIKKVQDYVTWGIISLDTLEYLLEKRSRLIGDKRLALEYLKKNKINSFKELAEQANKDKKVLAKLGVKPVFRLNPPSKGYEREGIKKNFKVGGALGFRAEKINALILRMA
ncbi:MAG: 50S ribosomal protein L30 [Candidatus Diapherotrites archaeon CG08_land_8_20_14_0_20_34_12]|nr:MAG: 50S ribosomal protein L30 [Candidatus Diapherotrites archaeon CG08_land_8_20_14_0_20_34_12]